LISSRNIHKNKQQEQLHNEIIIKKIKTPDRFINAQHTI